MLAHTNVSVSRAVLLGLVEANRQATALLLWEQDFIELLKVTRPVFMFPSSTLANGQGGSCGRAAVFGRRNGLVKLASSRSDKPDPRIYAWTPAPVHPHILIVAADPGGCNH
jgi:hypothetical protein